MTVQDISFKVTTILLLFMGATNRVVAASPATDVQVLQVVVYRNDSIYVKTDKDQQAFDDGCTYSFGNSIGRYRIPNSTSEALKDRFLSVLLSARVSGEKLKRIDYTAGAGGYCTINDVWF